MRWLHDLIHLVNVQDFFRLHQLKVTFPSLRVSNVGTHISQLTLLLGHVMCSQILLFMYHLFAARVCIAFAEPIVIIARLDMDTIYSRLTLFTCPQVPYTQLKADKYVDVTPVPYWTTDHTLNCFVCFDPYTRFIQCSLFSSPKSDEKASEFIGKYGLL